MVSDPITARHRVCIYMPLLIYAAATHAAGRRKLRVEVAIVIVRYGRRTLFLRRLKHMHESVNSNRTTKNIEIKQWWPIKYVGRTVQQTTSSQTESLDSSNSCRLPDAYPP